MADSGAESKGKVFDLGERTARFGEEVVAFCVAFPKNVVTEPLVRQFVRAGTSVGANYCEADDAVSRKEFRQKIGTCKKEARESKYWLRIMAKAEPSFADRACVMARGARTAPHLRQNLPQGIDQAGGPRVLKPAARE